MNKEIIKKYKDVFDWWLDGGAVWHKNFDWCLDENPNFDCINSTYVQDDEYVEFRKALVDGKTIQFLRTHIGTLECDPSEWLDWNDYGQCFSKDAKYRIKPDEPQFKKGDWVRDKTNCTVVRLGDHYHEGGIKHWSPEVNEVVILLDLPSPRIMKLCNLNNVNYAVTQFKKGKCIPYIGQPLEEMK